MKKFKVTIEAVIRKTMEIEADTEDAATEEANQCFTVESDGEEYYSQSTIQVSEC